MLTFYHRFIFYRHSYALRKSTLSTIKINFNSQYIIPDRYVPTTEIASLYNLFLCHYITPFLLSFDAVASYILVASFYLYITRSAQVLRRIIWISIRRSINLFPTIVALCHTTSPYIYFLYFTSYHMYFLYSKKLK